MTLSLGEPGSPWFPVHACPGSAVFFLSLNAIQHLSERLSRRAARASTPSQLSSKLLLLHGSGRPRALNRVLSTVCSSPSAKL